MNQSDANSKPAQEEPQVRRTPREHGQSTEDAELDECIDSLLASSKVYQNTGKIINKFLSKRDRVKSLLTLFDEILKEELGYIATLLHKFNKNITFDKFKDETVNNLHIYKENLKLAMNLLLDEKFEHINNQLASEKYPLIDLYTRKEAKSNTQGLKSSLMECIKEENEDVTDNYSFQERSSKANIEALDTIKRSHVDVNDYFSEMDKTVPNKEMKSPRNEVHKTKDVFHNFKDLKRLNRSSDRLIRKETSVPKTKHVRNAKNILSVQYFTNSVKQRFKMTPKLRKKESAPTGSKPTEKH